MTRPHVQGFIFPPPHLGGQTPGWPDPRRWPDRVARPFTRCWELASGAASDRGRWTAGATCPCTTGLLLGMGCIPSPSWGRTVKASDDVPPLPAYPPTPAHNTTPCRPLVSMHLTQQLSKRRNKLCSLRGAADPTSDASSVEASGFEFKLLKAQHPHTISEKLFEAS